MKAILVKTYGGAEQLHLEELDTPAPGEGQVRVRVEAAGVNFMDVYQRTGAYKAPLPLALGQEGAGIVEAVGAGVTGLRAGARVAWASVPGSYATHVVSAAERFVPVPDGVDARTAAAAMLQGMTAHYLVRSTYPLARGETCLMHAAAGGVGLVFCQLAKRAGARVLGTVGSEEKVVLAKRAGADEVILYRSQDFVAETKRLTGGRGVQVVYDSVGKDTFLRGLDALAPRGTMVLFGQSSGPVAPFDPQVLNLKGSLYLTRPSLGHYVATREELAARAGDVLGAIARGELEIHVGATFALADAAEAHRALEGRRTTGKVLLVV
jgi:NADPH:quinone reductase